jgi:signal transduction histidine kinase
MRAPSSQHRSLFSWLFLCLLFALCGVLGFLQYRWIGEVSVAARERLQGSLQASLIRLSQEFNSEIAAACFALVPAISVPDVPTLEAQLESRFRQWQPNARHAGLLRTVALAVPREQTVGLRFLNLQTGVLEPGRWPPGWSDIRRRLESNPAGRPWSAEGPPGFPPDSEPGNELPSASGDGFSFDIPIFGAAEPRRPPAPPSRREIAWIVFQIDPQYVRGVLLPELVRRYLGTGGESDYQVTVVTRSTPPAILYESDRGQSRNISSAADASVSLFDVGFEVFRDGPQAAGRRGRGGNDRGFRASEPPGRGPQGMVSRGFLGRGPEPDSGRWTMIVRHRAGSLEAVVSRTRRANLAVTAVVLLLMMATVAALVRYTRRAQRLAELQMDFVAGVSHELRTPLTVIHTAAYNLQGKLASQPQQVERYGALIQKESGRLKVLVEQILRFAGIEAGRAIEATAPVSVEDVIDAAIENSKALVASSGCTVEKRVAPRLPMVLGDSVALSHVVANLIGNAVKYGRTDGGMRNGGTPDSARADRWIGVSATPAGPQTIEIRVADRGPGIPRDEQDRIFDPFFRGARARHAQIHGTGLGLSISKKIVEAHGGTISVKSEPMQGAEFIVSLPAIPVDAAPGEDLP